MILFGPDRRSRSHPALLYGVRLAGPFCVRVGLKIKKAALWGGLEVWEETPEGRKQYGAIRETAQRTALHNMVHP